MGQTWPDGFVYRDIKMSLYIRFYTFHIMQKKKLALHGLATGQLANWRTESKLFKILLLGTSNSKSV